MQTLRLTFLSSRHAGFTILSSDVLYCMSKRLYTDVAGQNELPVEQRMSLLEVNSEHQLGTRAREGTRALPKHRFGRGRQRTP
jgi:hypothetical protein